MGTKGIVEDISTTKYDKFFFHLSGIHPDLPSQEIISILKSEKANYKIIEKRPHCLILDSNRQGAYKAALRAAYCRRAATLLCRSKVKINTLERISNDIAKSVDFKKVMKNAESYLVRVYRIKSAYKELHSADLETAIGKAIWQQTNGRYKAKMKNPDITFVLLFSDDEYFFGYEIYTREKGYFVTRRPDKRPFFKPGTLEPRFARMMVNLSQASSENLFLDPFCGPGGIILEAATMDCNIIGLDIDKRMIKGSLKNLKHFTPKANYDLIIGDAKQLPFHNQINSIATDPPYGRSTSTYGKEIEELLRQFFKEAYNVLVPGGILAIGMFAEVPIQEIAKEFNFELSIFEKIYIHKSLTRRIGVFIKK